MKYLLFLFVYLLSWNISNAQFDTLESVQQVRRLDAISFRPLAVLGDELAVFYDRGLNKPFASVFGLGFIRPTEHLGNYFAPPSFVTLTTGTGFSLRFGEKIFFNNDELSKGYVLVMVNQKTRFYNKEKANVSFDDPSNYTLGTISGTSYHSGLQIAMGYQFVGRYIFIDYYAGGGIFARRDFFNYHSLKGYPYDDPYIPDNPKYFETEERIVFYPSLNCALRIGLRTWAEDQKASEKIRRDKYKNIKSTNENKEDGNKNTSPVFELEKN